ncbi:VWA domain-containing protein [Corynebacterium aquatimens]|uniref:vWA domain-containing protein n=1 Tax=Corynebacterium TaxID=1716 RepID=UPI001F184E5E|nr:MULTISPECIES: vWA domain-containing protein [Corynebacterium]QYH19760.1 VWA domain-containing protein [Corynebacterium aquatimens]UIZ93121.1 VWA domain-containing protein [Corynebacterium sp. CNCTC7651]
MGRHSNGKNNYQLSAGAIVALVVALLLIAGIVWSMVGRGSGTSENASNAAEPTCVSGDLALPIAASNEAIGRTLVDQYAGTNPVVRDYCVQPVLVDSLKDAAVYIAPNTAVAHQELANAGRTAAVAEPEIVTADVVGLASPQGSEAPEGAVVGIDAVRFPTDTPASSAIAAAVLAGEDTAAVKALTDQRVATATDVDSESVAAVSEATTPTGWTFGPLDAAVHYAAIPLNTGDTVDENQSRAGQDFARALGENFSTDGVPAQPIISELVWAAALPSGGAAITADGASPSAADDAAVAADGEVMDTLFLLDTSEAMAPYLEAAEEGVAEAAGEVASGGYAVALWNYSSPLSEGVTHGYRRNIAFTPDAAPVQDAVRRFLTGGVPQTREAVTAALDTVVSAQSAQGSPARIVLITTGTADAGNDAAFTEALKQARDAGISVAVVHVGDGPKDQALDAGAASRQEARDSDDIRAAIVAAVGSEGER